jgi:hypothetical protein
MGDVIDLAPIGETLEFRGDAALRRDVIVGAMLRALAKITSWGTGFTDHQMTVAHSEIMSLQADLARAGDVVETMADACAAVHAKRAVLCDELFDGQPVLLLAANPLIRRVVAFNVEKSGARIYCKNFDIFEVTEAGVASMLERYAAA